MGPFAILRIRRQCRAELRKHGYTSNQIDSVIDAVDAAEVNAVAAEVKANVGAIGDGTILQAILDFFKSEQGQALIAALVKMLMALLIGL